MIIDRDFSFIRIRDNFEDAVDTNYSAAADLLYAGYAIQLLPGEATLQISNSPTNINLETFEVHIINVCQDVLEDVTDNFFITPFTDSNGISQVVWEWVNNSEFNNQIVILRFTDTGSGDFYYTNPFLTTASNSNLTVRFDYRNQFPHEGTQYNVAGNSLQSTLFYQSIRLKAYYNNLVNESERQEYHQISTGNTIAARNIKKIKYRYILDAWDDFTISRLETLVTNNEVYLDTVRISSTDIIEFEERELDSDMSEKEFIVNKNFSSIFNWDYQIFTGLELIQVIPEGVFTLTSLLNDGKALFNLLITLHTGSITIFDASDNSIIETFNETQLAISNFQINIFGLTGSIVANGTYYVQMTPNLVSSLGVFFNGINDTTTWRFVVQDGVFDSAIFDSTIFLTD